METATQETNLQSMWGKALEAAVCEHCDWSFLLPMENLPRRCPHCFKADLSPLSGQVEHLAYVYPPELVLPFNLSSSAIVQGIEEFTKGIWFPSTDLKPQNLQSRLCCLYLPMWLVDAEVSADWQAEAGFDYEVVSHQDRYDENRGGWISHKVRESRIRWDPRLGRLKRSYQNIAAPALEDEERLKRVLGEYRLSEAEAYQPAAIGNVFVPLPNRTPQDAWSDATLGFQAAAAEECRQAAQADHFRQFKWQPEFNGKNWTLLLRPLYTTFYLDDQRNPQPVLIHGQTGRVFGVRRASMKRGQRASLILLALAIAVFLVSLLMTGVGALAPFLVPFGAIGLVLALLAGVGAIVPVTLAAWFNYHQKS